jgi:hypothetical protein
MPNGDDKNWVRVRAAIEGFKVRHGTWPTRVRLFPAVLQNLREDLFSPEMFAKLTAKIQLISDEAPIVAEDDWGNSYSYGKDGFPHPRPDQHATEWLDVHPDRHG